MSSSQIAYFTKEEMVHACCGSSKILLYDLQQVIVDFNLDNKKFFYIDYNVSKDTLYSLSFRE